MGCPVTAVALWYVLCYADDRGGEYQRAQDCWWKTDDKDTRGEAQRLARKDGWLVGKRAGDVNLCPACRKLAGLD